MSDIKYLDPKELIDKGILFEINRRVLHPLGLALEVVVEDDGSSRVGGVWDYRDDPEGIIFDGDLFEEAQAKWNRFLEQEGNDYMRRREELLGFVQQTERFDD